MNASAGIPAAPVGPPFRIDEGGPLPLGRFRHLAAASGLAHGVTTRSGPAFGSEGHDPASAEGAGQVAAALGLAGAAWLKQVHGGAVVTVTGPGLAGEGDALVTATPGLAILGRSADCPLILVAGRRRTTGAWAVGMAHASWRSTVAGVTAAMMARLAGELDVDAATVLAAIAPSAGPCCYEVGPEVRDALLAARGPAAERFLVPHGDRWRLDLWTANLAQLRDAGVPAAQVLGSGLCTICQGERFWSWRVQRERAGRFAAAIGIRA